MRQPLPKRPVLQFRVSQALYDEIASAARARGVSISMEAHDRLVCSVAVFPHRPRRRYTLIGELPNPPGETPGRNGESKTAPLNDPTAPGREGRS